MTPSAYGRVPYAVVRDEAAETTYEAECASGEIACCEDSGPYRDAGPVEAWMRGHAEDTGHHRYLRTFSEYALVLKPLTEPTSSEEQTRANGGAACPSLPLLTARDGKAR